MKLHLLDNIGLKIAALFLAILVWLAVVNVNDPTMTKTITGVPVTVTNSSYLESIGMSSRLESGMSTVSVTLTGRRSAVEPLTRDDVRAEADLTQIVNMDADPIMVPVSVSAGGLSQGCIAVSPGNIEVVLEEMMSADFLVTATTGETRPSNTSYQIGTLTATPESVTITGPSSLIQIIDRVTAPVDVSRISGDAILHTEPVIYDKNGAQFTDAQLGSLRFSMSSNTISVDVDLWNLVSDVTIAAETGGEVAQGYRVGEVRTTPSVISLACSEEGMAALAASGNTITIPPDLLDVESLNEDTEVRVDITSALPSGVRLADNVSSTVLVNVEILPLDSKTYELPVGRIEQRNLRDGYGVIYRQDVVRIRVQGDDMDNLLDGNIQMAVDLSQIGEGVHQDVPVLISLPEGYFLTGGTTVSLELARIAESSDSGSTSAASAP